MHKEEVISFCIDRKSRFPFWSGFFFAMTVLFSSLSFSSGLDAKFKRDQKLRSPHSAAASAKLEQDPLLFMYKDVLSSTMYSKCTWLPSDSQHFRIQQKKCGSAKALFSAFGRFLNEYDAYRLALSTTKYNGHLHFIHLEDSCELF
jgi:hypothetical protein